jgi:hypothetical protein
VGDRVREFFVIDFMNVGENAGALVNAMVESACDWIAQSRGELFMFLVDYIGSCSFSIYFLPQHG